MEVGHGTSRGVMWCNVVAKVIILKMIMITIMCNLASYHSVLHYSSLGNKGLLFSLKSGSLVAGAKRIMGRLVQKMLPIHYP